MAFIKFHVEQNVMGTERPTSFKMIQILKVMSTVHLKSCVKEDCCVIDGKLDLRSCFVLNRVHEGIPC